MTIEQGERLRWWENRGQRSTALAALVGVVVGSAITGGVSLGLSQQALQAQRAAQVAEFDERRSVETREKRHEVYNTLLAAASKWRSTLGDEIDCKQHKVASACGKTAEAVEADAVAFRQAYYEVYVYGSSEALNKANEIAGTLPSTFPGVGNPVDATKGTIDAQAFADAIGRFDNLMCRELPAEPRHDC